MDPLVSEGVVRQEFFLGLSGCEELFLLEGVVH